MMKFMSKKNIRGSISILLIIVLMPMMAVAAIIVDAAGLELSKAMVSSASDLTMNTALTYYEETLKDVYGIFGVSATSEELKKNLEEYFVNSLIANGIINDEEEYKNSQILQNMGSIFSGNIGQVIDLDISGENGIILEGVDGTELSQPEILKTQIVEFMKYRTPIYGTMSILDGLNSLKKLSEQSKVTNAQVTVTEAIGDFNESLENAYKLISDMQAYYNGNTSSMSWDSGYKKSEYAIIHDVIIYLCENEITSQKYEISYKEKTENKDDELINNILNIASSLSEEFVFNYKLVSQEVENKDIFSINKKSVELTSDEKSNAEQNMDNIISRYLSSDTPLNELEQIKERLSYGIEARDIEDVNKFISIFNGFYDDVLKVLAYYDWLCDSNSDYGVKTYDYYTPFMSRMYEYSEMARIFAYYLEKEKKNADNLCRQINDDIKSKISVAEEFKEKVKLAGEAVDTILTNLGDVEDANNKFILAIKKYDGSNEADLFSSQMMEEAEYNKVSFSETEIKALRERLTEIENDADKLLNAFYGIAYSETPVKDIASLDAAYAAYKNKKGNYAIPVYTKKTNLAGIDENTYTFWRYLKKAFENVDETNDDSKNYKNASGIVDNARENADSAVSAGNGNQSNSEKALSEEKINMLPSYENMEKLEGSVDTDKISIGKGKGKAGKYKGFSTMLSNMSKLVGSLFSKEGIEKALINARDNLYVTDYAFSMFSYYTYEKEVTDESERKTVTGTEINTTNNQLYGAEIEYIVFGGDVSEGGKKSVDTSLNYIFAIRFMCNSVYALKPGSIDRYTRPPAIAIQTATCGIVPYKLPEMVFELALALAETYVDMNSLKEGKEIPLFKTSKTWSMSLDGAVNLTANVVKDKIQDAVTKKKEELTGAFNTVVDSAGTMVASNIDGWINDYTITIKGAVNEGLYNILSVFDTGIIEQLEDVIEKGRNGLDNITADTIIDNALNSTEAYVSTLGSDNIIYQIVTNDSVKNTLKGYASGYMDSINNVIELVKSQADSAYDMVRKLEEAISTGILSKADTFLTSCEALITQKVNAAVNEFSKRIKDYVGDAADVAADKILEITNNAIDKGINGLVSKIGISDTVIGTGGVCESSLLSFGYDDYLKMLLFIRLAGNSDSIMLRIADVIQMNTQAMTSNDKLQLSKLHTYIRLKVNVRYNTLFLSEDWFSNISKEKKNGIDINYEGIRGY